MKLSNVLKEEFDLLDEKFIQIYIKDWLAGKRFAMGRVKVGNVEFIKTDNFFDIVVDREGEQATQKILNDNIRIKIAGKSYKKNKVTFSLQKVKIQ